MFQEKESCIRDNLDALLDIELKFTREYIRFLRKSARVTPKVRLRCPFNSYFLNLSKNHFSHRFTYNICHTRLNGR